MNDTAVAARLRAELRAKKNELFNAFRARGNAQRLLTGLCSAVDATLQEAWQALRMPDELALVAVGGYGRGELFPYSDVDVMVLLRRAPDHALQSKIEAFIGLCWDLGLEIGSAVRTVDECLSVSQDDITVQTSLLEARCVTGNQTLFATLHARFKQSLNAQVFFQAKTLEMRQRHAKYQDTPYALEPNCKESPGGLRDLQVILWMTHCANFGSSWKDLHRKDFLTDRETRELARNERVLKTLRARLHLVAGRRQDVLVFDLQTALAEEVGFHHTPAKRASEQLMRTYYWAAKAVAQLNSILLQHIEAALFPNQAGSTRALNEHFLERLDLIESVPPNLFVDQPGVILETFLLFGQNPTVKGLAAKTLRTLYNARGKMDAAWRRDPHNRKTFLQILQQPSGVTHALRLMNQTSVLGRYLLPFRRIVGQMQHDLFHVYTVDQHILMVVRNIRRFGVLEYTHEFPFCSRLMANFDKPWVLVIAALFHDIGKGRGGDHSVLGMNDARRFCRAHDIAKEDTALIVWLVQHHLTMSHVAQKQDLSDPEVIRQFAALTKNERYLTALFLLTVADIRGTSPKVWNVWKGKLLEDLYRITLRVMGGAAPDPHAELERRQEKARSILRLYALDEHAHDALWKQIDIGFFMRHDAKDIAWLTRHLYNKVDSPEPVVKARLSPVGEGLQVVVYIKDQPLLFASICSYFEQKGFSIHEARVHTTRHGYALDTFQVTDAGAHIDQRSGAREILNLVEYELAERLRLRPPLVEPQQGRLSRQSRSFPITPRVDMRPDERGQYYLLSVSANDRTGLLYAIALVLARQDVSIHTARVNTLGERVEDIFLVDAQRLAEDSKLMLHLETDLLRVLSV